MEEEIEQSGIGEKLLHSCFMLKAMSLKVILGREQGSGSTSPGPLSTPDPVCDNDMQFSFGTWTFLSAPPLEQPALHGAKHAPGQSRSDQLSKCSKEGLWA